MNNKNILITVLVIVLLLGGFYYMGNKQNSDTKGTDIVSMANENSTTSQITGIAITQPDTAKQSDTINQPVVTKPKPTSTQSVTLKIGQKATINDVSITPVKVSYDSRCPKDVRCIQAGSLDLSVLLEKQNLSQTLILTSGKSVVFGNRTITISSVSPARVSATKVIAEADYRFAVTVSK